MDIDLASPARDCCTSYYDVFASDNAASLPIRNTCKLALSGPTLPQTESIGTALVALPLNPFSTPEVQMVLWCHAISWESPHQALSSCIFTASVKPDHCQCSRLIIEDW